MLIPWFQRELSIDECIGVDGGHAFEARLVDPQAEGQEQRLYRKELVQWVRRAIFNLDARERYIIEHRFGMSGGDERSLDDIAAGLELSRERVRQLEIRAKTKLRAQLMGGLPAVMPVGR